MCVKIRRGIPSARALGRHEHTQLSLVLHHHARARKVRAQRQHKFANTAVSVALGS